MQVNAKQALTNRIMRTNLRALVFALTAALTGVAAAQNPFWINGHINVANCSFAQSVAVTQTIYWGGTGNPTTSTSDYTVFPSNCSFSWLEGGYGENTLIYFTATAQCNGVVLTALDSVQFTSTPDTVDVYFDFNCSGGDPDCLGVPGGAAVAGSACDDGNPLTFYDMYMPNCVCAGVPEDECLTWVDWYQAQDAGALVPFEVEYSAFTAGAQPITYSWYFGDVTIGLPFVLEGTTTVPSWSRMFSGGESLAFMVVAVDANGCESSYTNVEAIMPCDGMLGSFALPGFPCTTFLGLPGTWTANCECVANAPSCEACFTTAPLMGDTLPVPFTAVFNNCSSGGAPPFSYNWTFPGGVVSAQQSPSFTFPGPGQYQVCLDIADAIGCTSTICNDITVNAFGGINTIFPAPPYPLIVHVDMTMCDPGTTATISSGAGAQPPYSFTVPLDADCSWLDTLWMTSPAGSVSVTLSCDPMGSINTQYFDFNLGVGGLGFFYSGCPNPVFDCLQIPNGPNLPGTPCQVPGTILQGLWSANCVCEPDTNATGCQAGFWVIQAYEADSLNPGGGVVPIPYELWVWNLSTGTSPFEFEWDFGDGTSSFDPYPTHVYGASGPYTLCLTLSDAASCSSIYCDEVSIDGDGFYEGMAPENEVRNGFTIRVLNQLPAAVPEQRFDDSRVWPNPVTDALNLSFRSTVSGNVPVSIIDLNGRVIRQESLAFVRGGNSISLNAADLPAGLYLLRVGNDTNTMNIRFVKQ